MKPTDTIAKRAELYAAGDFVGVYALYSVKSELRQYFREEADYAAHVRQAQSKRMIFQSLDIVEEKSRGKLAQVTHIERFLDDGTAVEYLTVSTLAYEDDGWRIVSEVRTSRE
jgi:precorrin-3B methylase